MLLQFCVRAKLRLKDFNIKTIVHPERRNEKEDGKLLQ